MKEQKQIISTAADGVFLVPRAVVSCLPKMDETVLKVMLYVCERVRYSTEEGAKFLNITISEFESAISYLKGAGIINSSRNDNQKEISSRTSTVQTYDSGILSEAVEKDGDFRGLKDVAEACLGKLLNRNDINSLFYLYDYVSLSAELLCGIIEYCVSKGRTSMQYIVKTALALSEQGIDTYDKFEAELKRRETQEKNNEKTKQLLGIGGRMLTPKEESYFRSWYDEMGFDYDMVRYAFEKTVDTIGSAKLPYINKILESWFEKGYKTPADVDDGASDRPQTGDSFGDPDDFLSAAIKKGLKV
ncbi:MAG: DnaD domain protein [Clostridia bacterium]|nr:DnaD domain protein [Clostridia bacterium]